MQTASYASSTQMHEPTPQEAEIAALRQELAELRAENKRLRLTEHRHINELAALVRHAEGSPRKSPLAMVKSLHPAKLKRKHWKSVRAKIVSHMSPGMKSFARKVRARLS
ncbi:hypothetical protein [Paracoccus sp. (in: a-proteobacteria)]|uniref:hypothetical protein n=1 Tax=Paracoccus sp. TaxID=267 RepID=UPI00289FE493|nr:hypothetical protein [Paracoccus sp. (in: a-proteobacteria)]